MSNESVSEVQIDTKSQSPSEVAVVPELVSGGTPETNCLDDLIRVLKNGNCPSLSGLSTLTYQLGCFGESDLHLRLIGNTGGGLFSNDWIPCDLLEQFISNRAELTSGAFKALFPSKSVNTGGFIMAVLKDLGLLQVSERNSRWHEHVADMTFEQLAIEVVMQEEGKQKAAETKGKRKPKEA